MVWQNNWPDYNTHPKAAQDAVDFFPPSRSTLLAHVQLGIHQEAHVFSAKLLSRQSQCDLQTHWGCTIVTSSSPIIKMLIHIGSKSISQSLMITEKKAPGSVSRLTIGQNRTLSLMNSEHLTWMDKTVALFCCKTHTFCLNITSEKFSINLDNNFATSKISAVYPLPYILWTLFTHISC